MSRQLIRYAIVPAAILLLVTLVRAWFEIHEPAWANWISWYWLIITVHIVWPTLLLRERVTFKRYMLINVVLIVLARLPVAAMYGLAFARQWKIEGTDEYVRYIQNFVDDAGWPHDASPWAAFAAIMFIGSLLNFAMATLSYSITWAISWRRERPFMRPAAASAA